MEKVDSYEGCLQMAVTKRDECTVGLYKTLPTFRKNFADSGCLPGPGKSSQLTPDDQRECQKLAEIYANTLVAIDNSCTEATTLELKCNGGTANILGQTVVARGIWPDLVALDEKVRACTSNTRQGLTGDINQDSKPPAPPPYDPQSRD